MGETKENQRRDHSNPEKRYKRTPGEDCNFEESNYAKVHQATTGSGEKDSVPTWNENSRGSDRHYGPEDNRSEEKVGCAS